MSWSMCDSEQGRERLKMSMNTPASWSMQLLRTQPGTPSGPIAFHGFIFRKVNLMSATGTLGNDTLESEKTHSNLKRAHTIVSLPILLQLDIKSNLQLPIYCTSVASVLSQHTSQYKLIFRNFYCRLMLDVLPSVRLPCLQFILPCLLNWVLRQSEFYLGRWSLLHRTLLSMCPVGASHNTLTHLPHRSMCFAFWRSVRQN